MSVNGFLTANKMFVQCRFNPLHQFFFLLYNVRNYCSALSFLYISYPELTVSGALWWSQTALSVFPSAHEFSVRPVCWIHSTNIYCCTVSCWYLQSFAYLLFHFTVAVVVLDDPGWSHCCPWCRKAMTRSSVSFLLLTFWTLHVLLRSGRACCSYSKLN